MVYFSFNDFVDCKQSGEIYNLKRIEENIIKYEQISGKIRTERTKTPIIEIIKNKRELKNFLKEFLKLEKIIGTNDIIYCNKIKSNADKINNNIIICKIQKKEIFIIVKEISEIDTNISYKMFEHSTNIIYRCNEEKGTQNIRNPIVIPIVIYTGAKTWKNPNSQVKEKLKYVRFKDNRINFSYNMININEISKTDLENMKSCVAKKIIEIKK